MRLNGVLDHALYQIVDVGFRPDCEAKKHRVESIVVNATSIKVKHIVAVSDHDEIVDSIASNGVGNIVLVDFHNIGVGIFLSVGKKMLFDVLVEFILSRFFLGLVREIFDDLALFGEVCDSILKEVLKEGIEVIGVGHDVLDCGWLTFSFFLRQFLFFAIRLDAVHSLL